MAVGRPSIDPSWMDDSPKSPKPASDAGSDEALQAARDSIAGATQPASNSTSSKPQARQPATQPASSTANPAPSSNSEAESRPSLGPLRDQASKPSQLASPRIPRQSSTKPLPLPRFHLPSYATIVAVIVAVFVLGTGAFVASEAGWISLGVEQYWGISNNPTQALKTAAGALAATDNYRVDGALTLTVPSATAIPALSPRGLAFFRGQALTTGRVLGIQTAAEAAGPPSQSEDSTIDAQFRQVRQGSSSKLESSWTVSSAIRSSLLGPRLAHGGTIHVDAVTNNRDLYIQLPGDAESWGKASLDELQSFNLQSLEWSALLAALSEAGSGSRTAGKTINGARTKGYQLSVPAGPVISTLIPSASRATGTLTVTMWLGTSDQRPYLIELNGSAAGSQLNGRLVFLGYDQVDVIDIPGDDQVQTISLSDWLEREQIVTVDTPLSRDAIRTSDLDRIQQALEEYATAQTPFAYPAVDGTVRLDEADDVAAALRPYLDPLPNDPLSPEQFYGYQSDSSSYQLTAVAEESTTDGVEEENGLLFLRRSSE